MIIETVLFRPSVSLESRQNREILSHLNIDTGIDQVKGVKGLFSILNFVVCEIIWQAFVGNHLPFIGFSYSESAK